ncbi:hypothetical protein PMAYCL1PPCAC_13558, partial [Pristionchus mayeri]
FFSEQEILFDEKKEYSSDCIKRISRDASIGQLSVKLDVELKFHREIYNLVKSFDVDHLILDFRGRHGTDEICTVINSSFFA